MENRIAWTLIARHLAGEPSAVEDERQKAWLAENPKHHEEFRVIQRIWQSSEVDQAPVDLEEAWNRLATRAGVRLPYRESPGSVRPDVMGQTFSEGRQPIRRVSTYLRFAAIILICVSAPFVYFLLKENAPEPAATAQEKLVVGYGQRISVHLPDGTTVVLDAGSELLYPKAFGGAVRELALQGEALFEVAHDSVRPFVVHAGNAVVRALGTRFDVQAWGELQETRVAVLDGRVALRGEKQMDESAVLIPPGHSSVVSKKTQSASTPTKVDVESYVAWMERKLILKNTPLREVVHKLERWYDLEIELPDAVYNAARVTGVFTNRNVDGILKDVGLTISLGVRRDKRHVVFFVERPA